MHKRTRLSTSGSLRLSILLALTAGRLNAQVIPAERAFTSGWNHAGYVGEIPAPARIVSVLDYGAQGNGIANDAPAINAAKAALGTAGGVIYFPAGTYAVPNDAIKLSSNIVLRGERSHNTTIIATNLLLTQTAIITVLGLAPNAPWMNILSGYDLHSWSVSLADVSTFSPGDWVETRQGTNTAWRMSAWPDMIGQILRVAAVTETEPPAGTLTFVTPLRLQYEPDLPLNGTPIKPQIRRFNRAVSNAGIENLRFSRVVAGTATMRNNVPSVYFRFAVNSWVRGCEFTNIFGSAVSGDYCANIEITGNHMHHAYEFDGGGSGYGISLQYRSSEVLIENNIFERLRHSMLVQAGANGNVFGYNYSRDQYKDEGFFARGDFVSDMTVHGNYAYANLFEGNCAAYGAMDSSHGMNGPHNTFFRNRARGTTPSGFVSTSYGLEITENLSSNQTFVGNESGGNYNINKTGIFEYGNNHQGTIKPAGTEALPDISYYLGNCVTSTPPMPAWWNIDQTLPVYGPLPDGTVPPIATERDVPARVRWFSGGPLTYAPPSLHQQPTNRAVNQGDAATFTVGAVGTPVARYQWHQDDLPIPGATNAVLVVTAAQREDAGTYRAEVHDDGGTAWSASAALTVALSDVRIIVQTNGDGSVLPGGPLFTPIGDSASFTVTAAEWHHIRSIRTNDTEMTGIDGLDRLDFQWGPLSDDSELRVVFAPDLTSHGVPKGWLAERGFTEAQFEAASLLDSDGDGHSDWLEFLAGTDPEDPFSVLHISESARGPGQGQNSDWRLRWPSASGRTYAVWWTTNLSHGFQPLASNLAATPPRNEYTQTNTPPAAFYRIKLE